MDEERHTVISLTLTVIKILKLKQKMEDEVCSLRAQLAVLLCEVETAQTEKQLATVKMEQAAEHGLLLLQQKSQLQRDLQGATELNTKAKLENNELISELENKKYVSSYQITRHHTTWPFPSCIT